MKKQIVAVTLVLLMLMTAVSAFAMDSFYVKTSNGKGLNLRSYPQRADNVIASIPYGAQVEAIDVCLDGVWINVSYNGLEGYVMMRYLSSDAPGPKPTIQPRPTATARPSSTETSIDYSAFTNANYYATVRATISGGIVHMRWAPSKQVAIKRDCDDGDLLQVIAVNSQWAQVRDPETGEVGFMIKSFLQENAGLVPTDSES